MLVRRLGWAGLELEAEGCSAVIDLLRDASPMEPYIGKAHGPLPPPATEGDVLVALATHMHSDHADPWAVAKSLKPGGLLLRPESADGPFLEKAGTLVAEEGIKELGISTRVLAPWESTTVGPFEVTAVPAADGLGDPQVSWVVRAEGQTILHAGDTVFHGWWWHIAMRFGPFDAVFLPANGPVVDLPHRQPPSALPAAMTPVEAATAAGILGCGLAVPIHYGTLHKAGVYVEVDDPEGQFMEATATLGVTGRILKPGEALDLDTRIPEG